MKTPTKNQEERFNQVDNEIRRMLPLGVKLVRTLRGHNGWVGRIAWSPDGRIIASPSSDKTIGLWDAENGNFLAELIGHSDSVHSVSFNASGDLLASGSSDGSTKIWDIHARELVRTCQSNVRWVHSVTFDPQNRFVASSGFGESVNFWGIIGGLQLREISLTNRRIWSLAFDSTGHTLAAATSSVFSEDLWQNTITLLDVESGTILHGLDAINSPESGSNCVAFDPMGRFLASCGEDRTVKIWERETYRLVRTLEGHTAGINCISFLFNGLLLASKGKDDTVRLWNCETGTCVAVIPELASQNVLLPGLAFHPNSPLLATVGSDPGTPPDDGVILEDGSDNTIRDRVIHIWELDLAVLLGQAAGMSAHYVNAKVVLLGDTGVGKSGLSLVLNKQKFEATDSTPGRRVWTFDTQDVRVGINAVQRQETLLWDLAGQPGYRIIHQLHLKEIAVALIVFDARSETDPLAGVRHWERALRLAQQRQGTASVPMKKFLVSARNDRGGVAISEDRLQIILKEFGFDGYFKTSAKEGWQITELRLAIEKAIEWGELPEVSSSQLFADIKSFLLEVKKTGQLLSQSSQLYDNFAHQHPDALLRVTNLRDQFETCIGRLENRDLIRRLTFGDYVLLQPELLDAYGSAMVHAAKEEPDGLGSLAEETALAGKFFVPKEQKISEPSQEQLLLHATVEELVRHDLALRENANDGRYLVFPSQFNRDYEDAPEPKGKAVAITFDGPVQSLYSTLAVRLGHSGLFSAGRAEMWRNAAVFTAKAGGKCGLFVQEFAEGRGRLIIFFQDDHSSAETRFHFEEFVLAHAKRRSLDGSVELVRFFVCSDCGDPVPDSYVKRLREKGKDSFDCPCGGTISLAEPKERIHFRSKVEAMDKSADRQRDMDAFVMSAKGETSTNSFRAWAGGDQVTLAIVFTDVVGSTALGEKVGDEAMTRIRRAHFAQSRKFIGKFQGREIKTIGDSFMAAFRDACSALDYAHALQKNTGHPEVQVRAGIHIGPILVEEGDVFGGTVNFAARVVSAVKDAEIWVSDRAKEDTDRMGTTKHKDLKWERHDGVAMKGFPGKFTLWAVK